MYSLNSPEILESAGDFLPLRPSRIIWSVKETANVMYGKFADRITYMT